MSHSENKIHLQHEFETKDEWSTFYFHAKTQHPFVTASKGNIIFNNLPQQKMFYCFSEVPFSRATVKAFPFDLDTSLFKVTKRALKKNNASGQEIRRLLAPRRCRDL
jgi:hypothetical protein